MTIRPEAWHRLRAIDEYTGEPSIGFALKILSFVFVRSVELRGAEWREFDFEAAMWVIPAERMKMKRPHTASVARQVLSLLGDLRNTTGNGQFLFPSLFSASRETALRAKGMQDQTQGLLPICFDLHMHIICTELIIISLV
ncbi:hypothetical protein DDIC_08285 [Desulfovibrio desulfuricans]|uniref:Tyr recombinase domain-containing protein n=1 Tax=Desulfovibrio desulfuricans TaxID=876 RepID=A0A4P7UIH1_DESDE|nr:hypothetical protein [Desulfovibrio desulfuricans]QCC85869.1 hypothetical protein DDIC_08285 [Desulfovibrio desulfuricans]